ncbi:MAG: MFS transporter [Firmicutes bacterium]|nr:MFS transporter [Bacillota bacterium]
MIMGYGLGSLGMGAAYYFMSAYFVLFLTNCVGLNSTIAGTIASVALMVEFVAGMVVGNISDRCTSSMGRRRPFMLAAAMVMLPVLILILHYVDLPYPLTVAYYLVLAILFRMFFSTCEIPYNALGAEIAPSYDERTRLRTISRVFSIAGNAIGYIMPLVILDLFASSQKTAWQVMGIILGCTCFVSWMILVMTTKDKPLDKTEKASKKANVVKEIFSNYLELFKLKTMKLLIIYKAGFSCAFSLYSVGTMYFLLYSLGLDNRYSSYVYIYTIIIFAVSTPFIDRIAILRSKAFQQMAAMGICGILGIIVYFAAPQSVIGCALYIGVFAIVQTGFWQISGSLFYDIVEVDEFVNNKRREGDIMSLVSVLGTLITAVMVQIFGAILDMTGFDASLTQQPESVVSFLNCAYILVPSLCLLIGAAALKIFPINKETFASLQSALNLRKEGKSYEDYMEDLKKIVEK